MRTFFFNSVGELRDGEGGGLVHIFNASSGERSKLVKLGRCVWNSEGSLMANAVLPSGRKLTLRFTSRSLICRKKTFPYITDGTADDGAQCARSLILLEKWGFKTFISSMQS